jgi:Na+-driven multidrug efflux pump
MVRLFLKAMLVSFGVTENILPSALEYEGITSFGIPFLLFSTGTNSLVRADRSPRYSMVAIIIGEVLNTILDPIFIFRLGLGDCRCSMDDRYQSDSVGTD